jgi:hypothetical protein
MIDDRNIKEQRIIVSNNVMCLLQEKSTLSSVTFHRNVPMISTSTRETFVYSLSMECWHQVYVGEDIVNVQAPRSLPKLDNIEV